MRSGAPGSRSRSLPVTIAPHDLHAECRGGIGVPGVRRLERDRSRRQCRADRRQAGRPWDAACRRRRPRPRAPRRAARSSLAHCTAASSIAGEPFDRIAVWSPAAPHPPQHRGHLRKGIERQIEAASAARAVPRRRCRASPAQSRARRRSPARNRRAGPAAARSHVYCSCLSRHRFGQPSMLAEHVAAAARRRSEIEQGAVGVEHAGFDANKGGWFILTIPVASMQQAQRF